MRGDDPVQARFLSVLSHDLRGALHTVQLSLEMLRRDLRSDDPDAAQMAEDLDLGQRALVDAAVRLDRLVTAERLRRGVMPVRPHSADLVAGIRRAADQSAAAAVAAAGEAGATAEVLYRLPDKWLFHTDPRLVGEMIGGLVDHALRRADGRAVTVCASPDAGELAVAVDRPDWVRPADEQMLQPAAEISSFDPSTVSLVVAGRCAELLRVDLRVESDAGSQRVRARFPRG